MYPRDVFISHASEDKALIARPIDQALNALGVTTWIDEGMIEPGESLIASIGRGLASAGYVLLVISPTFIGKGWTELEVNNALASETRPGGATVIPVVVDLSTDELLDAYPMLADKRHHRWNDDADRIASNIARRLGRSAANWHMATHPTEYVGDVWIRVTPSAAHLHERHDVMIVWGNQVFLTTLDAVGVPVSLTHHKLDATWVPLQLHITPPAIVAMGRGPAPDFDSISIDQHWFQANDASVPPSRFAPRRGASTR